MTPLLSNPPCTHPLDPGGLSAMKSTTRSSELSLSPFWQAHISLDSFSNLRSSHHIVPVVRKMIPFIAMVISQASGGIIPSLELTNMSSIQTAGWPFLSRQDTVIPLIVYMETWRVGMLAVWCQYLMGTAVLDQVYVNRNILICILDQEKDVVAAASWLFQTLTLSEVIEIVWYSVKVITSYSH